MKKNNSIKCVSFRNKFFFTLLYPLLTILFSINGLMAQQVIGSFPTMDGGFEGQASSGALTNGSYASGSQSSVWTTSSSSMGTFQTASPRTGGKYVNINYTSTTKRLQSPTAGAGAIVGGTVYTVQFYYKTAGAVAPGGTIQYAGASSDGTNPLPSMGYTTTTALAATSGVWTKASASVTASTSTNPSPKYGYLCPWRTSAAMAAAIDIDDVVLYEGALDVTAPDPVTIPNQVSAAATQQTISWTAPGAGVDGGGYMVVRGLADPTTTPNANGIYAVGNFVAGTEKVVYLGTNTSFVDLGLTASTTYYYRIYTVDKAFNYSTATTLTAATGAPSYASEPTNQASGISFANVTSTSMDINWTAGNGTNSLVVVRVGSAVNADPADGDSYAPNSVYGSGTQIGTGNFSVYNGTGNSVTITGLSKAITYNVKVYTFNGSGGSENYLLSSPATGSQLATPGEIVSNNTSPNTAPKSYSDGTAWIGGVPPGQFDNVTIKSGDFFNIGSTQKCYNLTIESGAKLSAATAQTFQIFGTSLTCEGTFGDPSNTVSLMTVEFGGNLVISGAGGIYPYKFRPVTGLSNIGITFNSNTTVTYATVSMQSDNTGNDNVTFNIPTGKTVTLAGSLSTTSSSSGIGNANTTVNVNGTLNIGNTLNTTTAIGKSYTVNVNGDMTINKLNILPAHAVQAPSINVTSPGSITVTGTTDASSTTITGALTGTGTFNLNALGTINTSAALGLEPVAGPIRTATRNFNTGANYGYVGTSAQVPGSDFPATVNNLTLNNAAGLSLGAATTVNGILTLTAGALSLANNDLTLGALGTISGGSATAYIATTGTGKLTQPVAATTAKLFPIGTVSSYDPVTVTPTDATNFSAKVYTSLSGTAASGYFYNAKEWDLTSSAPSSTLVSFTPSVVTATGINAVIGHYVSGDYVNIPATLTGSSYAATVTSFSPFVTGQTDLPTGLSNGKESQLFFDGQIIHNNANIDLHLYDATGKFILSTKKSVNMASKANGIYIIKSELGTQKISVIN